MSRDNSVSACEYKRLAKKLKDEDFEQFQTLVYMHLSFVLHLNLKEEGDENVAENKKNKSLVKWPFSSKKRQEKPQIEGKELSKEVLKQLHLLIEFLSREESLSQEGIFRRSGKVTRQQELKSLLAHGRCPDLNDGTYSVHDCATVLKNFLAELHEPLLTELHYPAYCQVADLCHSEDSCNQRLLGGIQLLLLLLPTANRKLFKDILRLLHLTASHANLNRMSAQNLATLFTPHLLCPRKLSPEALHTNAQNLSCVVVFMIKNGLEVFELPEALGLDIKVYWDKRRLTPNHLLDQSKTEAETVFHFCDRALSHKSEEENPTETALARLYAHIQSLPESNKKKKLIKQFNKENGFGTPRTKTLGDSIKKHIPVFSSRGPKKISERTHMKYIGSSNEELLNSLEYNAVTEEKIEEGSPATLEEDVAEEREIIEAKPLSKGGLCTPGGNDNTEKSETSSSPFRVKPLPPRRKLKLERTGAFVGRTPPKIKIGNKLERARRRRLAHLPVQRLPVQSECSNSESSGSVISQSNRRFRPLVVRRETFERFPSLLSGQRHPSIYDEEFWLPPIKKEKLQGEPQSSPEEVLLRI